MTDTDCRDEVRYLLSRMADLQGRMADLQGVIARQKEMLDAMKADRDYQKVCRIFAEAALRNADQKVEILRDVIRGLEDELAHLRAKEDAI